MLDPYIYKVDVAWDTVLLVCYLTLFCIFLTDEDGNIDAKIAALIFFADAVWLSFIVVTEVFPVNSDYF